MPALTTSLIYGSADIGIMSAATFIKNAATQDHFDVGAQTLRLAGVVFAAPAALNNGFTLAHAITMNLWGTILVQRTIAAGTVSTKVPLATQAYTTRALALAAKSTADAGNVAVGYIIIQAEADTNFTADTSLLTTTGDELQSLEFSVVGGAVLWKQSAGVDDAGVAYHLRAKSNPNAPAGAGGEASFHNAFLTITWTKACTLEITPIVDNEDDDEALTDVGDLQVVTETIVLPAVAGERRVKTYKVPLYARLMIGGVEFDRWPVRGTRLKVLVETTGVLGAGDLIIDGAEVEYEVVRESNQPEAQS